MGILSRLMRVAIARRRLRHDIALWHHREYTIDYLYETARTSAVDSQRAERILGSLRKRGVLRRKHIRRPESASFKDLLLVHTPTWIEDSMNPSVLAHVFGMEEERVRPDELVSAQRRAVGGTIAAARSAAFDGVKVAINLGGGFHHAGPEQGSGFCIYNDVAIAIRVLRSQGYSGRIAVIDLDFHQGDGTLLAFSEDNTVQTASIHGAIWCRSEAIENVAYVLPENVTDAHYLEVLDSKLVPAVKRFDPALIFYLAGNDVLAQDRLGGFALTLEGVLERDKRIATLAQRQRVPLVVTLAGGYSDLAWRASASYISWLLTGAAFSERIDSTDDLAYHYEKIANSLDPRQLQKEENAYAFSMEDLMGDLSSVPRNRRLLGYYSVQGVELALERYGLMDSMRKRGFRDLEVEIDPSNDQQQIIRAHGRTAERKGEPMLLVELVLRQRHLDIPEDSSKRIGMLSIEWMLLQNPARDFSLERPRLPGQKYRGLGITKELLAVLVQVCKRVDLQGIVTNPGYYHIAFVMSGRMQFLDPKMQGRFLAFRDVLIDRDLAEATRAVDEGNLKLRNGETLKWEPADLVLPVSDRLKSYFDSEHYLQTASHERSSILTENPLVVIQN